MGLLAPLYALAALAIAGPIIFHLIKRQPRGRQTFSSLMFLSSSPPRLTRRSRLDNLLLLVLRGLAIALIAFAFARPFFRNENFFNQQLEGRSVALLIDTSASMQRDDVWAKAIDQATKLLDELSPADRIALFTIDDSLHTRVALEDEKRQDAAAVQQAVRAELRTIKPTWRRSKLADGLKAVADQLQAAKITGKLDGSTSSEVVLISDLHQSSGLDSLQGYPWPEAIALDVRQIRSEQLGNARANLMTEEASEAGATESIVKVRIENNADSVAQAFELAWSDSQNTLSTTSVQVPAGQVRVIPLPTRPTSADRVVLRGDTWDKDNVLFVSKLVRRGERIAFVAPANWPNEDDLGYFLEKAPLSTSQLIRKLDRVEPNKLTPLLAAEEALAEQSGAGEGSLKTVIVEFPIDVLAANSLRAFASRGGCVIAVFARPLTDDTQSIHSQLSSLCGVKVECLEAPTKDFALLSDVNFTHPLFRPFADPRFNDFSKIRFWNHRRLAIATETRTETKTRTEAGTTLGDSVEVNSIEAIAKLDDGSPLILQQQVGKGNVWLLSTGWQPKASQLALSTKFVPLLLGMLDPSGMSLQEQLIYEVGDAISVGDMPNLAVTSVTGQVVDVEVENDSIVLDEPGLYTITSQGHQRQVAVQIPATESQLTPLDTDVFEQYGVKLGKLKSDSQRKETERQLQITELERKQRVWQWLILAGLVVLALETGLAGWLTRQEASK